MRKPNGKRLICLSAVKISFKAVIFAILQYDCDWEMLPAFLLSKPGEPF